MTQSAPEPSPAIPSSQRVYEAVCELRAQAQTVTRETVAELTGLKLTIVDDRLAVLVDDGKLKRVLRGVYEVVEVYPPARPISKTVLGDGHVKYEIGDDVLTLTPTEDRTLALLTAGAATQVAAIEAGRQQVMLATEMATKIKKLEREVTNLRAAQVAGGQMTLLDK